MCWEYLLENKFLDNSDASGFTLETLVFTGGGKGHVLEELYLLLLGFCQSVMGVKRNIIILSILWLVIIIGSFSWNYAAALNEQNLLARFTARSFFDQIVITRKWNALHGGLYAPITETTPPNPYNDMPDRDLEINSSLKLTKIDPAYMTRQLSEIANETSGIHFHITSLNPIRPGNKSTERETVHLKKFEQGVLESSEFFEDEGKQYYFYMAPLVTDKSCLACHAKQGYQKGDIRGGISLVLPFESTVSLHIILLSHLIIALLGLLGLAFVGRTLNISYRTIEKQAVIDSLTGIPNRRSFTETINREFNRSFREEEQLAIIMFDIDNFKDYNDTYGHSAGDECLKKVAQSIAGSLQRPGDFYFRYGGEEFVVILVNTGRIGAMAVAERIRHMVENRGISHSKSAVSDVVTISVGVATLRDNPVNLSEELIKCADDAMYQAKRSGKNQVRFYQSEDA